MASMGLIGIPLEEEIDIERAVNEAMLKNARRAYGAKD